MNKALKIILLFLLALILSSFFAEGFKNVYSLFNPLVLSEGFFEVIKPGLTEGFLLAYLFFLPIIFIPAFYQQKLFYKLIPFSLIGLILMVIPWQALLLSLVIYFFGVLFGVLAVWLHKKI